jgi:hypothetical protein
VRYRQLEYYRMPYMVFFAMENANALTRADLIRMAIGNEAGPSSELPTVVAIPAIRTMIGVAPEVIVMTAIVRVTPGAAMAIELASAAIGMHRPATTAIGMHRPAAAAMGYMASASAASTNKGYEIAAIRCGSFEATKHLCLGRLL